MSESLNKTLAEKTFASIVRKSLGDKSLQVIKKRLFEKYGISLYKAVNEEYDKLSDILKENFAGGGARNIEKQFLAAVINLHKQTTTTKLKEQIIDNVKLVQQIMGCIGDKDMMLIINDVMSKSKLVSDILKSCKLPQTSGYRKINKLVDLGLLIISGYDIGMDGRHLFKYTTSFESIGVFMEKGKSKVKVKPKKIGKNSYVSIPFVKKS